MQERSPILMLLDPEHRSLPAEPSTRLRLRSERRLDRAQACRLAPVRAHQPEGLNASASCGKSSVKNGQIGCSATSSNSRFLAAAWMRKENYLLKMRLERVGISKQTSRFRDRRRCSDTYPGKGGGTRTPRLRRSDCGCAFGCCRHAYRLRHEVNGCRSATVECGVSPSASFTVTTDWEKPCISN